MKKGGGDRTHTKYILIYSMNKFILIGHQLYILGPEPGLRDIEKKYTVL